MAVEKQNFLINAIHNSIKDKHNKILDIIKKPTPQITVKTEELNNTNLINKAIQELTTLAESVNEEENKRKTEYEERKAEELIAKGKQAIDEDETKKNQTELDKKVNELIEHGKTIINQPSEEKPEDDNKTVVIDDLTINTAVNKLIGEGEKIIKGQTTPEQEESKTTDVEKKSTDDTELIEEAKKILIQIANNNMTSIMAPIVTSNIINNGLKAVNDKINAAYEALIAKAKELLTPPEESEETEELKEEPEETKEPDCSNVIIELLKEKALNAILKQTITEPESESESKTETMNYDTITQLLIANGKLLLSKPDEEKKECSDDILVELLKERALRAISEQMAKQSSINVSGTDEAYLTTIAQLLIKHGELMLQQSTASTHAEADGSKINTDTLVNLLEAIAKNKLLEEMLSASKSSNTSSTTGVTTSTSTDAVETKDAVNTNLNKYINDIPAKFLQT